MVAVGGGVTTVGGVVVGGVAVVGGVGGVVVVTGATVVAVVVAVARVVGVVDRPLAAGDGTDVVPLLAPLPVFLRVGTVVPAWPV